MKFLLWCHSADFIKIQANIGYRIDLKFICCRCCFGDGTCTDNDVGDDGKTLLDDVLEQLGRAGEMESWEAGDSCVGGGDGDSG